MKTKGLIAFFVIIFCIGLIISFTGFALADFNFSNIKNYYCADAEYSLVNKTEEAEIKSFDINCENNIVNFVISEDGKTNISYYESSDYIVSYSVTGGAVKLNAKNKHLFQFNFKTVSEYIRVITIAVPETFKGSLNIFTANGRISIDNPKALSFSNISLRTSNGKIFLNNVNSVNNINLSTSNGDISLDHTVAGGQIKASDSNGKIILNNVSGGTAEAETSNGSIEMADTVFSSIIARNSNGAISLTDIICGNIKAKTSNGKIDIKALGIYNEYKIIVETSNGDIHVNDLKVENQTINSSGAKIIDAETSNGSIDIHIVNQ